MGTGGGSSKVSMLLLKRAFLLCMSRGGSQPDVYLAIGRAHIHEWQFKFFLKSLSST